MEKKGYKIRCGLSKTKIVKLLRDHVGGYEELKLSDFSFRRIRDLYFIKFCYHEFRIEMAFHYWAGKIGFRLEWFVYPDEYTDRAVCVESRFVHVDLDYLFRNKIAEEVSA